MSFADREALLRAVIKSPNNPSPVGGTRRRGPRSADILFTAPSFGGQGGLSAARDGVSDIRVVALLLDSYDRWWPRAALEGPAQGTVQEASGAGLRLGEHGAGLGRAREEGRGRVRRRPCRRERRSRCTATSTCWSDASPRPRCSSRSGAGSAVPGRPAVAQRRRQLTGRRARVLHVPMRKRRVAVVGATGIAGQQALVALADHPWFEVTTVAASARTAGRPYRDAIRDKSGARQWWCREEPSEAVLDLRVVGRLHARPRLGRPRLLPHRVGRRARAGAALRDRRAHAQQRVGVSLRSRHADHRAGCEHGVAPAAHRASAAPARVEGLSAPAVELHRRRARRVAQAAGRRLRRPPRAPHHDAGHLGRGTRRRRARARHARQPDPLHSEGRGEGRDGGGQDPGTARRGRHRAVPRAGRRPPARAPR